MESNNEKAERLLNESELDAYRKYVASGSPPLSPSTAAKLFALYLQGYTCAEIAKQTQGLSLGIICRARIDLDWDQQKAEYVKQLMDGVRATVEKSTLEAVQFAHDGMAVFHKLAGGRFKRYLQTGEEKELGDWKDMSFKTYKDMVELWRNLTGQDNKNTAAAPTAIHHVVETQAGSDIVAPEDRPVSSSEAAGLLKLIGGSKDES